MNRKEYLHKYYLAHKTEYKLRTKEREKKYPELYAEYTRNWTKRNPEAVVLKSIRSRCNNPNTEHYNRYGGRGIKCFIRTVDELIAAIGRKPKGMSIDRIDNNGHYTVGNIRWATQKQQMQNRGY